jgi:hypothetical protein
LIDWVNSEYVNVTEEGMFRRTCRRAARLGGQAVGSCPTCVFKREVCRIGDEATTAARRFWSLPLGVVLKRVMKGIWWMPWH